MIGKFYRYNTLTLSFNLILIHIRPDVVDQVFHARLEALVHNLRKGKYFDSKLIYIIRVIEYQFRGLPHAHIVFRLENGPNHQNVEECTSWIDKYICTSMPNIIENSCERLSLVHI